MKFGSAEVIPFPSRMRKHWIARQINNVADYRLEAAVAYLDKRISERTASLRRAGVPEHLVAADLEPVRAAFDAGLTRLFGKRTAP